MKEFEVIVEPKPWYMSRGVIGGVVAAVSGLLGLGVGDAEQVVDLIVAWGSVFGGALSVYGRMKAKRAIAVVQGLP